MIAIIVPTVNRAHLLAELVSSIHAATTTPHSVCVVVEADDTATATALLDVRGRCDALIGQFGSYTAAANAGVRATLDPYFLVANDDVTFHADWDTAALVLMVDPVRVVGIDQGNGRTDCFFLVDRRYLHGGDLYHPEYRSQYCDTEFADTARHRGVWADLTGEHLIEHRHWTLGKAQMDDNYRQAVAASGHDAQIYEQRRHLWEA